jgi:hypothetical protein
MKPAAEPAVASAGEEISTARAGIAARCSPVVGLEERHARVAAEPSALRAVWSSFWRSRLLIWAVSCLAVGVLGTEPDNVWRFDATGISTSFGSVGNVLGAAAVRGDAIWYLRIAHAGYSTAPATRFFPLYPLLLRAGSWVTRSLTIAGVLISFLALLIALVIIHRLTVLELGARAAKVTVELIAFGPLALFLSAVYSESLFLAFSAGTFYAARRGRWAYAGALGGLAALTRVTGVLLVVPVLLLYLYGPRDDAEPDRPMVRLMPRHRVTPAILWAALIPLGTAGFSGYLTLRGYGPLAFLHAQTQFSHHRVMLPFVSVWDGALVAWQQLKLTFEGISGFASQTQGVVGIAALAAALVALCGVFRRLPFAYGAFVVVGLLVPLTSPTIGDPLKGLARYETVMFPLFMWAGLWVAERGTRRVLLLACGALLLFFTAQFATWNIVGSQLL